MIRLENLCKELGGRNVLDGVNLHVRKGESLVIVGSSGTGKSVTLRHIIGLMQPDDGNVLVNGVDISTASRPERHRVLSRLGVLFQSGALINWMTVFDNVALPLYEHTTLSDKEIRDKVRDKLQLVNLEGADDKKPGEISGGMKKRVGLARAIVTDPDLLLYDEPTSGLDPVMSRMIDDLIVSLQERLGATSVIVTHDLHSAFTVGDRIAMLHEGKVAEISAPQDFVHSNHAFVQQFIHAQFQTGKVKGFTL